MDSTQIAEWQAFYSIEPFGEAVEWYRTGVVASTVANMLRNRKSSPVKPTDFVPKEPKKKQTPAEMKAAMLAFYNASKHKRAT